MIVYIEHRFTLYAYTANPQTPFHYICNDDYESISVKYCQIHQRDSKQYHFA